jgi:hypothetical protein
VRVSIRISPRYASRAPLADEAFLASNEFERQGFGAVSMSAGFSAEGLDGLRRWDDDLLPTNEGVG